MAKFNFNNKKFDLIFRGHPEDRSIERAHKCSLDQIGPTLRAGLSAIAERASSLKKDIVLVNEGMGHSVVLMTFVNKLGEIVIIVKTVIDEARRLFISKKHQGCEVIKISI